jgi:hypothetical protein
LTDKILVDGEVLAVNNQAEQRDIVRGLGLPPDLDRAEANAWRRFIPRQIPWREVAAYEQEILKLEERHREVESERDEVSARLRGAADRDADALAEWERGGRSGRRPALSLPQLEEELARRQDELQAVRRAIDQVTSERAAYVANHRDRLTKEAEKALETARARAVEAVGELEEARAELIEARRVLSWSALYPSPEAGREPSFQQFGGGLRRILEPLGLAQVAAAESIRASLRQDIDWIKDAVTVEQQQKLEGSPRTTQEGMEQARDRQVAGVAALRRGLAQDTRAAELDAMKRRDAELGAIKRPKANVDGHNGS